MQYYQRYINHSELYEERIVNNSERNWVIVRLVKRAVKLGKYVIVLVERVKHLDYLSSRLDKERIPHRVVSGTFRGQYVEVKDRLAHQRHFEKGKIRVIVANKVFNKGVDIHRVDVVINATGRKSANDAIQIFGRGVRTHDDKKGLIHIDISDVDSENKNNPFQKASKRRARALRSVGITVKNFIWEKDGKDKELFRKAEKWLKRETEK